MSVVMGIDPSLSSSGICYGDGRKSISGIVKLKPGIDPREVGNRVRRVKKIAEGVEKYLKESSPSLVMIESYSYGSRTGGEYLGELGGVLRSRIYKYCNQVLEVSPSAVKKFATGKGNSKKELVIGHILKRWDILFETTDEADAYVLYRIGLCYLGECDPENEAQRQVIAKIKEGA